MQKACRHRTSLLRPLVSTRFQVLFHSPSGVLFTFPSRYLFTIGRQGVLSLAGWSPRVPTGFPVPGRTQELQKRGCAVSATGPLPSVACSSMHLAYHATLLLAAPPAGRSTKALQPRCDNGCRLSHRNGLGSSPFARHYSGSRGFFPFLWVLRCFSSPACLFAPYVFRCEYHRITSGGFPHSEISGSKVGQHLTRAYRSRPRPSSALGAKASTVCPYSLDREELASYCYGVFKVHADRVRPTERAGRTLLRQAWPGLSKLNSVRRGR